MVETNRARPKVAKTIDDEEPEDLEEQVLFPEQSETVEDPFEIIEINYDIVGDDESDNYVVEEISAENPCQHFVDGLRGEDEDTSNKIKDILDTMGLTINYTLREIFKANRSAQNNADADTKTLNDLHRDFEKWFEDIAQVFVRIEAVNRNMWFLFKIVVFLFFINMLFVLRVTVFNDLPDLSIVLNNLGNVC